MKTMYKQNVYHNAKIYQNLFAERSESIKHSLLNRISQLQLKLNIYLSQEQRKTLKVTIYRAIYSNIY